MFKFALQKEVLLNLIGASAAARGWAELLPVLGSLVRRRAPRNLLGDGCRLGRACNFEAALLEMFVLPLAYVSSTASRIYFTSRMYSRSISA